MEPVSFVGGAFTLQRDKDDDKQGPIFALSFPLKTDELALVGAIDDLLSSTHVHIEGFVSIMLLFQGYCKLWINQHGYKFYLEISQMYIYELFQCEAKIAISYTDDVQVFGKMKSRFTDE